MKNGYIFSLTALFVLFSLFAPKARADKREQCPDSPVINRVVINMKGTAGPAHDRLFDMARRIIRLEPGECFSDQALVTSVELLRETDRFSAIHIPDPDLEGKQTDIRFVLTPIPLIRKISVSGAFPVFQKEVVNRTDYRVGRVFHQGTVEKNASSIENLLKERGYINPEVTIRTGKKKDLSVPLTIHVEKGEFYRIKNVDISGNTRFSDTRLKMLMETVKLPVLGNLFNRFAEADLKKDIRTLTEFYREKDFYDVDVKSNVKKNPAGHKVDIEILIDEGPEYSVDFTGNTAFASFFLKKELVMDKKGNINGFGLRRSLKNIRKKYISAGYPDAAITHDTRKLAGQERPGRHVTIHIAKNTRYLVSSVKITGNKQFTTEKLKNKVLTSEKGLLWGGVYVKETMEEDRLALEHFYRSRGFDNVSVKTETEWQQDSEKNTRYADVIFHITEGMQAKIASIRFKGVSKKEAKTLKAALSMEPGDPCTKTAIRDEQQKLLSILAEEGFIYTRIDPVVEKDKAANQCTVTFSVKKKTRVTVGGSWVFGTFKTDTSVLPAKNRPRTGETVSLKKYSQFQTDIRETECIRDADFRAAGLKNRADELFFLTHVQEEKPYFIESSLGFDTQRDAYLSVAAGDGNFLGKNRELTLDAAVSGIGYETGAQIKGHDFLDLDIETRFRLFAQEEEKKNQTFGSKSIGSLFSLEREFFKTVTAGASLGIESKEQYQVEEPLKEDPDLYQTRTLVSFSPFLQINRTDSFMKPENGYFAGLSTDYTRDIKSDLDHFIRYKARLKYYRKIAPKLVLAVQGMYGEVINLADDSKLPEDQLFYLGGSSTVRGYQENKLMVDALEDPAGGKKMASGSIEARINLWKNWEVPVFIDAGTLLDMRSDTASEKIKWSVGTGIRYMTPIGPVGLLYGRKLNPEPHESAGRFHFSIGYTF